MEQEEYKQHEESALILNDDGGMDEMYRVAAENHIRMALGRNYTERFKLMTKLMRISIMLSQAKITHKKM